MLQKVANDELDDKRRAFHDGISAHYDAMAETRHKWQEKNRYFYRRDLKALRNIVPEGMRVLELGCGNGDLLANLKPSKGIGVDLSEKMVEVARQRHPSLTFVKGNVELATDISSLEGPFDYILMSDLVGHMFDAQMTLELIHKLMSRRTRLVITFHNSWWEPFMRLWIKIGRAMPRPTLNWFAFNELVDLLKLEEHDLVQWQRREISPIRLLGLGSIVNKFLAPLPGFNALCFRYYLVARSRRSAEQRAAGVTLLIPCRNEKGNIEGCVKRSPEFGSFTELLFVEGNSSDGTYEECCRVRDTFPERRIRVLKQTGKGKGDAVRLGFHEAAGDIVMIVDSDLAVPPEYMPRIYRFLAEGGGEFINCTRLVYPMAEGAMKPLNYVANRLFAKVLSYLLNQRFSDTLCGTKALFKDDYMAIEAERTRLGSLDPFGDFDLIFGAARANLKIVEIPVRYDARSYGSTQISRFADGWMLFKMVWRAFRQLKAR